MHRLGRELRRHILRRVLVLRRALHLGKHLRERRRRCEIIRARQFSRLARFWHGQTFRTVLIRRSK